MTVASLAIVVVLVAAVRRMARPDQPLEQRRSPSSASRTHDVGRFTFQDRVRRPVACGAVSGLTVAAATDDDVALLEEVVTGICKRLRQRNIDPVAQDRVVGAARRQAVIGFAQFERTGEDSTTIVESGQPMRVAINARYSHRGKSFKAYLAAVVVHELMHAGAGRLPVSAEDEFVARLVEHQFCLDLLPNQAKGRSCTEAETIVGWGRDTAVNRLRGAGYP